MQTPIPHRLRSDRGQAVVEFALVAPLLIVLLLGILQGGVVFNHYLTVTDAARAASRQAIVARISGGSADSIKAAAKTSAGGLNVTVAVSPNAADFRTVAAGTPVTVTVSYPYSIDLLGWVVSSGQLSSSMTDALE